MRINSLLLLSQLNHPNVKKVCVHGRYLDTTQTPDKVLPLFMHLQHLSFISLTFDTKDILYLSEAQRACSVPCLTHLSFRCCYSLRSNLALLFRSPWPHLTHLGFDECDLNITDVEVIGNSQVNYFPNLSSMALSFGSEGDRQSESLGASFGILQTLHLNCPNVVDIINRTPTSNFKKLSLRERILHQKQSALRNLSSSLEFLTVHGCLHSLDNIGGNLSQNLIYLDISFNSIGGTLSVLLRHSFRSLNSLILRDLRLSSHDLSSLAAANVEDRLPKLKHLDISGNKLDSNEAVSSLFDHYCTWDKLISLNIMDTGFSQSELHKRVESGCLSSLKELRITDYPYEVVDITWPVLRILGTNNPSQILLANVADAVEDCKFPTLQYVCLEFFSIRSEANHYSFFEFHRLSKANISCHVFTGKDDFCEKSKCACQQNI